MTIPELTHKQRVESFMTERLSDFDEDARVFTKEQLAIFCLEEIDYACELVRSTDIKDVEEQFEDD